MGARTRATSEPACCEAKKGEWTLGVAQGCNCRSILDAIATLIEAQRLDLAMLLIEQKLNCQT